MKIWTKCRLNFNEVEYFHKVECTPIPDTPPFNEQKFSNIRTAWNIHMKFQPCQQNFHIDIVAL